MYISICRLKQTQNSQSQSQSQQQKKSIERGKNDLLCEKKVHQYLEREKKHVDPFES